MITVGYLKKRLENVSDNMLIEAYEPIRILKPRQNEQIMLEEISCIFASETYEIEDDNEYNIKEELK